MWTFAVSMVSRPPPGMASRELTARFTMACSTWFGSALMLPAFPSRLITSSISSPISRCSIFSVWAMTALRLMHARLHDLAAAEGQQLIGQGARPIGGFENLFGVAAQRIQRGELVEDHPVVAGDDGQHVVEVVRHATGQASHGLHLLRVHQLLFEGFALGDVADEGDPEEAVVGFDSAEADFDGKFRAILAPPGEVEADSHGAGTRPVEVVVALAGVGASLRVGQEQFDPRAQQFLRGVAEHLGSTAIDQNNPSRAIDTDNCLRCRFQESD